MTTPRVWLVTGASSGFGRLLTEFVLNQGDIVVATLRKPEVLQELSASYSEGRLLVLKLDVIDQGDIDHAFARTKEVFGRLDVVFNNAGYAIFGDAETMPMNDVREMFEVNFWGAVNISRAAIKFFREVNKPRHGVLLQNSAVAGIDGIPGLAFYSASKHGEIIQVGYASNLSSANIALDGFSEALAREVLPEWNIKICIIAPGGFHTNVLANSVTQPMNSAYNTETSVLSTILNSMRDGGTEFQGDPAKFVRAIYALVDNGSMPLHLPIGQDALEMAKLKMEALGKDIVEAAPWSADLLRNGI